MTSDVANPDDQVGTGADLLSDATADQSSETEPTGNREAAKYRRQLRDVEAERDALRSVVDFYRKADVERRVSDALEDRTDRATTRNSVG